MQKFAGCINFFVMSLFHWVSSMLFPIAVVSWPEVLIELGILWLYSVLDKVAPSCRFTVWARRASTPLRCGSREQGKLWFSAGQHMTGVNCGFHSKHLPSLLYRNGLFYYQWDLFCFIAFHTHSVTWNAGVSRLGYHCCCPTQDTSPSTVYWEQSIESFFPTWAHHHILDSFSKAPLRATLTLFWGGSRSFLSFVSFDMSFFKK